MYAKEILEPLGMEDTAFWIPQEKQHRLTNVYESIRTQDGQRKLVRYTGSIWVSATICPVNLLLHPAEQGLSLRWMII